MNTVGIIYGLLVCLVAGIMYFVSYKIISYLLKTFINKEVEVIYFPAPSNYEGIPPEGMTWNEAWKYVLPSIPRGVVGPNSITFPKRLELCPKCNKALKYYQSDLQVMEDNHKQYMVTGEYCLDGHYTHLDCA